MPPNVVVLSATSAIGGFLAGILFGRYVCVLLTCCLLRKCRDQQAFTGNPTSIYCTSLNFAVVRIGISDIVTVRLFLSNGIAIPSCVCKEDQKVHGSCLVAPRGGATAVSDLRAHHALRVMRVYRHNRQRLLKRLLKKNYKLLTKDQRQVLTALAENGHASLFKQWPRPGAFVLTRDLVSHVLCMSVQTSTPCKLKGQRS